MSEVAIYEGVPAPLKVEDMKAQVNLIQHVMRDVMKKDEHYGVVPGTNGKPSLLKAGAEKLIMTFRLVPEVEEQVIELPYEHREYRVKVRLSAQNGIFLGTGIGSCSTMEGKYRFRTGPVQFTGSPVPKEYWDIRKTDPAKAQALIGGAGYSVKKRVSEWEIVIQGEKVEHDNPADHYNTCLKMAKKRALVDACLTVTAASDIFTQDIEDMPEVIPAATTETKAEQKSAIPQPQPKPKATAADSGMVEIFIENVQTATGEKNGKPWTKYGIVAADGKTYGTFDKTIGDLAIQYTGQYAEMHYEQAGKFLNCVALVPIEGGEREPGQDG